jgi:hypothetical protein
MLHLQRSFGHALSQGRRGLAAVVSNGYGDHKSVVRLALKNQVGKEVRFIFCLYLVFDLQFLHLNQ